MIVYGLNIEDTNNSGAFSSFFLSIKAPLLLLPSVFSILSFPANLAEVTKFRRRRFNDASNGEYSGDMESSAARVILESSDSEP